MAIQKNRFVTIVMVYRRAGSSSHTTVIEKSPIVRNAIVVSGQSSRYAPTATRRCWLVAVLRATVAASASNNPSTLRRKSESPNLLA